MAASATTHGGSGGQNYGRLFVILWIGISVVATPLTTIVLGRNIPPGNGSTEATSQVLDNQVLLAVSTPIAVFVLLFLGFALTVFRARGPELVDGPPVRGDSRIQILWLVVTTTTVLFLAAFGTFELFDAAGAGAGQGPSPAFLPDKHASALDVQVIAQQWEFTYRYPGSGGVETPHLVLPAHTLIRLHVTSLDVVHSFWAYELGVKADANPGTDNVVYVTTNGPRSFHIRCAELCGLWHGYMFDTGRVVPAAQFASWTTAQQATFKPVQQYLPPYATTYLPDPQRRAG
ncbi:MAG: cytochrome c oxidase subunit II [Actinobacteria bacterium]|nr:cytochrome c oxidase subunit II [Actinomycetota bacterium]